MRDVDDLMLLSNIPAQVESLLQVGGIGLNMNVNKTEYMCFKEKGPSPLLVSWRQ